MEGKKVILIEGVTPPTAPISLAVSFGSLLFISGQVSKDLKTGEPRLGTIEEQTEQVLKNIETILNGADSSPDCVLKTTVFLRDMKDFPKMNEVYKKHFPGDKPTRSTVGVALAGDYKVEIEAIAFIPGK
jgi:2-iminobutanoate/2-iminopropanoate deaminase